MKLGGKLKERNQSQFLVFFNLDGGGNIFFFAPSLRWICAPPPFFLHTPLSLASFSGILTKMRDTKLEKMSENFTCTRNVVDVPRGAYIRW